MSTNSPNSSRRRIAGERRSGRGAPDPTPQPAAGSDRAEPDTGGVAAPEAASAPAPAPAVPIGTDRDPAPSAPRSGPAGPSDVLLVALAVLAFVLVVGAVVLGTLVWNYPDVRKQDQVADASRTAPGAAERAAVSILSYDYRSLPADKKAAERYMTPAYRKDYDASFDKLVAPNAPKLRARVTASVRASGVMSPAGADAVDVLVYVNQTTVSTANSGEPQVALNRAKFSMRRSGDGAWLVDKITSY